MLKTLKNLNVMSESGGWDVEKQKLILKSSFLLSVIIWVIQFVFCLNVRLLKKKQLF